MEPNTEPTPEKAAEGAPRAYIRTYAADAAALESGRTPDLTPFSAPAPASSPEPLVSPASTPPAPPPAPPISPLQTYAGDFADRLQDKGASAMTILAAEQDAGPAPTLSPAPRAKSRIMTTLPFALGILLIVLGGVGAYMGYRYFSKNAAPIIATQVVPAPIFVDERESLTGDPMEAFALSLEREVASGGVRLVYAETSSTTPGTLFSELYPEAPSALLRNIQADGSMAGVVSGVDGQSAFFILSVLSYGDTFAALLSWENQMPSELAILFPTLPSAVATTTAAAPLSPSGFLDEVVGNHDARVYRDEEGRSVLLYGYWDQKTLVITRNPDAYAEILSRLGTTRSR